MTWYILLAEGLLIAAIIVWMIMKRKAIGKADDDQDIAQETPGKPDLELPDEEKWE